MEGMEEREGRQEGHRKKEWWDEEMFDVVNQW